MLLQPALAFFARLARQVGLLGRGLQVEVDHALHLGDRLADLVELPGVVAVAVPPLEGVVVDPGAGVEAREQVRVAVLAVV